MIERYTASPEMTTSAEKDAQPLNGEAVSFLLENASYFNQKQLSAAIYTEFLDKVEAAANEGRITSRQRNEVTGEVETITLSAEDIFLDQLNSALELQDTEPNEDRWKAYIPRAMGLRDATTALMLEPTLRDAFRYAVYAKQIELQKTESTTDPIEQPSVSNEQQETDPYDYFKKLYPPVTRPPRRTEQGRPFGQYIPDTTEDIRRKYYDKFVTDENKQRSIESLLHASLINPDIQKTLNAEGIAVGSLQAVDAIREDPAIRAAIAKILTDKLEAIMRHPNELADLINYPPRQYLKSDAIGGSGKYTPPQYVVYMALKMIDGEFSEQNVGIDKIEKNAEGQVAQGRHRHAAQQVLYKPLY